MKVTGIYFVKLVVIFHYNLILGWLFYLYVLRVDSFCLITYLLIHLFTFQPIKRHVFLRFIDNTYKTEVFLFRTEGKELALDEYLWMKVSCLIPLTSLLMWMSLLCTVCDTWGLPVPIIVVITQSRYRTRELYHITLTVKWKE